jgi:hypothetical protein
MNNENFPAYLAFGKLNQQSIRQEGDQQKADYELLGNKVMEVTINLKNVEIQEFNNNISLGYSCYPTLKGCLLNHFMACPIAKSGILENLIRSVCELGNIFYDFPKYNKNETHILYYPAIELHVIRVPINSYNIINWGIFLENKENENLVHNMYKTTLFINEKGSDEIREESIHLAELVVPIAYIYERVQLLFDNNLILPDKLHRAIIQNSIGMESMQLKLFYGTENDSWSKYGIQFKPLKSRVNGK